VTIAAIAVGVVVVMMVMSAMVVGVMTVTGMGVVVAHRQGAPTASGTISYPLRGWPR
jgi:hypothetical protein